MRNISIPTNVELPTSEQLVRSTFIAIAASAVILIAVVLPSEYGVDPTGIGRALNLTQMGEIKVQLAQEAEADRVATAAAGSQTSSTSLPVSADGVQRALAAAEPAAASQNSAAESGATGGNRSDEMAVTLTPGQGAEVKLTMVQGAQAKFSWKVSGGVVNFDLHGDGGGRSARYERGRASPGAQGVVEAAFDGNHGWYWRNRGTQNVTVTLQTNGAYSQIKRVI